MFCIVAATVLMGMTVMGCGAKGDLAKDTTKDSNATKQTTENTQGETGDVSEKHHVEISVKDYGKIQVELYASDAPISVENFMKLTEEGFYDGLTFHRIITGFMIQGGDPTGTGFGGSEETIKGEFASNGVENNLSHTRGAISMARSNAKDSASSQFFICHADSDFLDGNYACFGYVTAGMDVVDAICAATPVVDDNGTVLAEDQPIIEYIKVID